MGNFDKTVNIFLISVVFSIYPVLECLSQKPVGEVLDNSCAERFLKMADDSSNDEPQYLKTLNMGIDLCEDITGELRHRRALYYMYAKRWYDAISDLSILIKEGDDLLMFCDGPCPQSIYDYIIGLYINRAKIYERLGMQSEYQADIDRALFLDKQTEKPNNTSVSNGVESCSHLLKLVERQGDMYTSYSSLRSSFLSSVKFYLYGGNWYAICTLNGNKYIYSITEYLMNTWEKYAYSDSCGEAWHKYIKPHKIDCN